MKHLVIICPSFARYCASAQRKHLQALKGLIGQEAFEVVTLRVDPASIAWPDQFDPKAVSSRWYHPWRQPLDERHTLRSLLSQSDLAHHIVATRKEWRRINRLQPARLAPRFWWALPTGRRAGVGRSVFRSMLR